MAAVRQAIAQHARTLLQPALNPDTDVLVTAGATEAMFAAILGFTDPGDEVIVFEPVYDTYVPNLVMAGVTPHYVALRGDNWTFDPDDWRRPLTRAPSAIVINTPHNPTGKVFRATSCGRSPSCAKSMMSSPSPTKFTNISLRRRQPCAHGDACRYGERTLTISSLGKTFSVTGWKIGWAMGPAALVKR